MQIKFEVDTDPPPDFATETKFCLRPVPFSVLAYTPASLFAGKMHAVLCRGWGNRVKGRDWYDFVWYVGRNTALDLPHLEARMRQSGHLTEQGPLTEERLRELLREKVSGLDVDQATADVARFLRDDSSIDLWSPEFFLAVVQQMNVSTDPR